MEFAPGDKVIYIDSDTCKITNGIVEVKLIAEYRDKRRIVKYKMEDSDREVAENACFCSVNELIDFATRK